MKLVKNVAVSSDFVFCMRRIPGVVINQDRKKLRVFDYITFADINTLLKEQLLFYGIGRNLLCVFNLTKLCLRNFFEELYWGAEQYMAYVTYVCVIPHGRLSAGSCTSCIAFYQ